MQIRAGAIRPTSINDIVQLSVVCLHPCYYYCTLACCQFIYLKPLSVVFVYISWDDLSSRRVDWHLSLCLAY